MEEQNYYGFSDEMFNEGFEKLESYKFKTGQHKFRILPPYAANKLYHKVDIHWGYSDQNGNRYPVKCLGENICPICRESARLKSQSDELLANSAGDPQKMEHAKSIEKRASDTKRKPTYIYQILDISGQHKSLSLSFRQHESIYKKIMFYWKEKKVNITDPNKNMVMYVDRSGNGAQTHYQVEVLENTIKKIDVPKLAQLHELHEDVDAETLNQIVVSGFLPTNGTSKPEQQQQQQQQQYAQQPEQQQQSHQYNTNNQNGTPSHSATEGAAGRSQPSQGSPATSSPQNQSNNNQPNSTVQAFCSDDVAF